MVTLCLTHIHSGAPQILHNVKHRKPETPFFFLMHCCSADANFRVVRAHRLFSCVTCDTWRKQWEEEVQLRRAAKYKFERSEQMFQEHKNWKLSLNYPYAWIITVVGQQCSYPNTCKSSLSTCSSQEIKPWLFPLLPFPSCYGLPMCRSKCHQILSWPDKFQSNRWWSVVMASLRLLHVIFTRYSW